MPLPEEYRGKIFLLGAEPVPENVLPNVKIGVSKLAEYPSAWFNDPTNAKKKPEVTIIPIPEEKLSIFKDNVVFTFWEGSAAMEDCITFLYHMVDEYPGTLTKKWESFGRLIGEAGEKITLSNLAKIVEDGSTPWKELSGKPITTAKDRIATAIGICGMYRLCQNGESGYMNELTKKVSVLVRTHEKGRGSNFDSLVDAYRHWIESPPYTSMMAAIDMFLFEFPIHTLKHCRVGSMVSRNKDCSALMSIAFLMDQLNLDTEELAMWILNKEIGRQYSNCLKRGEELEDPRSYSRYFMDYKCSTKSPYSAAENAGLHAVAHATGTTMLIARSKNARLVGNPDFGSAFHIGCLIGFVYMDRQALGPAFGIKGVDENDDPTDPKKDVAKYKSIPKGRSVMDWRHYIRECGNKIPHVIIRAACNRIKTITELRPKTIGQQCHDLATAYLAEEQ